MLKRILKLGVLVKSAVVLPLIFGAFYAQAITCRPYDDYSQVVTIPIIGSGMITAGEDLPVGSVLYAQQYKPVAGMTGYFCNGYTAVDLPFTVSTYLKGEAINTPMGAPDSSTYRSLFPTNVPGVAFVVDILGQGSQFPYQKDNGDRVVTTGSGGGQGAGIGTVTFKLIKTGPIASSTQILGTSLPTIQFSQGMTQPVSFETPYLTVNFSGVIDVVTRSCEVSDIDVDMGKYNIGDFNGVGSVTDWKDFQITLRNCPPFYGYYPSASALIYSETNGITSNGAPTANYMKLSLKPTNSYVDDKVMKLESGWESATGIGIQIADENETLLSMNSYYPYTPNFKLTNVDGATYVLPLKARYYQYGSTVKGGKANGSVMYTISYY